jgi:phospholipid N-methyltransferase
MPSTTAGLDLRSRRRKQSLQRDSLQRAGLFLKNFARHPHLIGSAIPSSRYLINRALDHVDWKSARTIVEYGPGVGSFTRHILARMSPNAHLLAIEVNAEFCEVLDTEFRDSRLEVVRGSAADVTEYMRSSALSSADFIMSGIPYTFFPRNVRHSILRASRDVLSPQGVFISYQYTRSVLPDLREVFSEVAEDFELMNILPARIFYCSR